MLGVAILSRDDSRFLVRGLVYLLHQMNLQLLFLSTRSLIEWYCIPVFVVAVAVAVAVVVCVGILIVLGCIKSLLSLSFFFSKSCFVATSSFLALFLSFLALSLCHFSNSLSLIH